MAGWQLRVHRYNRKTVESRISNVRHIHADDFMSAVRRANDIVTGMKDGDPECEFKIIELCSYDYHGTDCDGGIFAFETKAEMTKRLATAE